MRRLTLLFAILFVLLLFGYDLPKEYDGKMANGIEGTWQMTKLEVDGVETTIYYRPVFVFRAGIWERTDSNGDWFKGTYCIDSTQTPTHLDLIVTQATYPISTSYIYQVKGDTLRIAHKFGLEERGHPKSFTAAIAVWTYKRVK